MSNETSGVTITIQNGIQKIAFNNPRKRNAIQMNVYDIISDSLISAAQNDDIFVTVLTGTGDFYSSGFLIAQNSFNDGDMEETIDNNLKLVHRFVNTLIDYPKLLVAVVNGPAVGIAVTTLGLCDIVYASDRATFQTPFSNLGLCAEGCASYTFPIIMGISKSNELLLTGYKMSAEEAYKFGLVSHIYKHSELENIWEQITKFKDVSQNSIRCSKNLIRSYHKTQLHQANKAEVEQLKKLFLSDDFMERILAVMTKTKSKL